MVREKNIRVSDEELQRLKKYRDEEYDSSIPLGYIIGELVEDVE